MVIWFALSVREGEVRSQVKEAMMSRLHRMVPIAVALVVSLLVAPMAMGQEVTPSVTVSDQPIENGTVTVDSVVSDGPGWIVIHSEADDAPGPSIGYAAVEDGENEDVVVEIDVDLATETLYAMLHADTDEIGVFEFPDADPPVEFEGEIVMQAFTVTAGLPEVVVEEEEEVTPSVTVQDQDIVNESVVVQEVVSDGPGFIVIHADEAAAPGPIIGYSPVEHGQNLNVVVTIEDMDARTDILWAMLHEDTDETGEFDPETDPPVEVEGEVVMASFSTAVTVLPVVGGEPVPVLMIALLLGGAVLLATGIWLNQLRAARISQE